MFLAFLASMLTPIVHAYSLNIEARVGNDIEVALIFENINVTSYYNTKKNEIEAIVNVKNSFEKSFNDRNLTATVSVSPLEFNDENQSITIRARLSGSMLVSMSVDPTSLNRTYEVITVWRKFRLTIIEGFVVDLRERFKVPIYEWNITKNVINLSLDDSSFTFVLPEEATNIKVDRREIITFMVSANFVDKFLNSPVVALVAIILAPAIALTYRRIKLLRVKIKR
jgi:hypothetical protein